MSSDIMGNLAIANNKTTTLGSMGWKGSGHESRANAGKSDLSAGQSLAKGVQTGKTIGSVFGLGPAAEVTGDLTASQMTPGAQRAYANTMGARPAMATAVGKVAGRVAGIPSQPVNMAVNMVDLAAVDSYVNSLNPDAKTQNRTSDSVHNQGYLSSGAGTPQKGLLLDSRPAGLMWEPASYGFGDYGSHIKGLLS